MKVTKCNQAGIDLIHEFESLRLKPYLCQAGVPTIGWGTTRYFGGIKVTLQDPPIGKGLADRLFSYDLQKVELEVDALVRDDVNENQFAALCSFVYNLGRTALKTSTLLRKVNANPNDESIAAEFPKWKYADGEVSNGLIRRRKMETILYFKPV